MARVRRCLRVGRKTLPPLDEELFEALGHMFRPELLGHFTPPVTEACSLSRAFDHREEAVAESLRVILVCEQSEVRARVKGEERGNSSQRRGHPRSHRLRGREAEPLLAAAGTEENVARMNESCHR